MITLLRTVAFELFPIIFPFININCIETPINYHSVVSTIAITGKTNQSSHPSTLPYFTFKTQLLHLEWSTKPTFRAFSTLYQLISEFSELKMWSFWKWFLTTDNHPIHPTIQQQWIDMWDGFNMQYEPHDIIYGYFGGIYSGNGNCVTVLQR